MSVGTGAGTAATAVVPASPIDSLLQLQHMLLQCNSLEKAQKSALRELRTKLVQYENTLTRTLTLDHSVHAILEHGARSSASGVASTTAGGHVNASFATAPPPPTNPPPPNAGAAIATALPIARPATGAAPGSGLSAAEEREQRERDRERDILSAVRRVNFISKPFGYSQELGYKQLLTHLRSHPALLAQALSAVCAPPVRWSADTVYRMEQLSRCLVVDVYGGNTCVHDTSTHHPHSSSSVLKVHALHASEYQFLRLLRDTCTLLYRRHLLALSAGGNASGSFSLLEHNSFSSKLLSAYMARVGSDYLRRTIRDTVQSIVLNDEYDFNTDFTNTSAGSGAGEPLFLICRKLITAILSPAAIPATAGSARTAAASPTAPAAVSSLSIMPYGIRYLARLLTTLSESAAAVAAANAPPPPVVAAAPAAQPAAAPTHPMPAPTAVPQNSATVSHPLAATSTSPPPAAAASAATPAGRPSTPAASPSAVVADFIFLQWIVNALMYPDSSAAGGGGGGGLVELSYPISPLARRNLQVVGTVLLKLANGSRFATYQQSKYTPLNQFLDSFQPQMNAFLRQLTEVEELEEHFSDVPGVVRVVAGPPTATDVKSSDAPIAAVQPPLASSVAAAIGSGGISRAIPAASDSTDPAVLGSPISAFDQESDSDEGAASAVAGGLPASSSAAAPAPASALDGVQRLEPIAILPNDLFTLHRLLRSVLLNQQPTPAPAPAAAATNSAPPPLPPRKTSVASTAGASAAPVAAATTAAVAVIAESASPTTATASTTASATPTSVGDATTRTSTPPPPAQASASASPAAAPAVRVRLPASRVVPLLTKTTHQLAHLVAKSRARITKLLTSIGDPAPYVSTADNQYVLLDAGVTMLDSSADGSGGGGGGGGGGGEDGEFKAAPGSGGVTDSTAQRLSDLITASLSMLRPLPTAYRAAPISVLAVLRAEAEREWALGNTARAAIVLECVDLLNRTTPPQLRYVNPPQHAQPPTAETAVDTKSDPASGTTSLVATNGGGDASEFGPLLDMLIRHYQLKHRWLLSNDVCGRAVQVTGLIVESSEWLSARDKSCTSALLDVQIGRVLSGTQPKIRGLVSYLAKQDETLSRTPLLSLAHANANAAGSGAKPPHAMTAGAIDLSSLPYSDYMHPPPPPPAKANTRAPNAFAPPPAAPPLQQMSATDSLLSTIFPSRPLPAGQMAGHVAAASAVLLPACAGLCPESIDDDRFCCENCQRRLEAHKRTARSFTSKYAVVSERDVRLLPHSALASSSAAGAVLSPNDPFVQSKISDYVIAAAYSGMFVRCSRADVSWQSVIRLLQTVFPDFASFYQFVNTKEDKRTLPASMIAAAASARAHGDTKGDTAAASPTATAPPPSNARPIKLPQLSSFTFDTAIKELAAMDDVRSVNAKLLCFARCRDVISAVLQQIGSLSSAGADDYIPALCYVLIRANPATLLSNIQFVRVFCDSNQNHKGFVDVCVAVKYLAHLKTQLVTQHAAIIQRMTAPPATATATASVSAGAAPPNSAVVNHKPNTASAATSPAPAAILMTTLGTLTTQSPPAASGGAAPSGIPASGAVRDSVVTAMKGMGFAEADILAGVSALTATDLLTMERAFPQLLDWCTDLAKLTEMNYPRDFAIKALLHVGPRNIPAAVQYIDALQLRG